MEKVFIKPTTREILIKGAATDGHMDIFVYDPSDEQTRRLGNLYVIGHVQHETDDMTYAINLISALAKREYYASGATAPKEAFTATLKKINEVVEEFFEHKGVKINIGIFAIAGEQMYISKLGRFKVMLARDDRTIDVLNHISFDREKVQEKQFSSVISGHVQAKDRVLAYYPTRAVVARERYLKMYLTKFDADGFSERLQDLTKSKNGFSCALVYVNLDIAKEVATAPRIEPRELAAPSLAAMPKRKPQGRLTEIPMSDEHPVAPQIPPSVPSQQVPVVPPPKEPQPQEQREIVTAPRQPFDAGNEIPRIIPTEFSLGRKHPLIPALFSKFRVSNLTPKHKAIVSFCAVVLIIGVTFAVQYTFGLNSQTSETNGVVKTTREQLELAKVKISQNDATSARGIIGSTLASITNNDDPKVGEVRDELVRLLDELDQAVDAVASIVAQIPSDQGVISRLFGTDKAVFAYTQSATAGEGLFLRIEGGSIVKTTPVTNTQPNYLTLSSKGTPVIIDTVNQKSVALKDPLEIATFTLPQPLAASYIYEDNLYAATDTGLFKLSDVFKGEAKGKSWLKREAQIIADVASMVVDGTIYVTTKSGTLATYYRGEKTNEFQTGLDVGAAHLLLTTNESPSLYVVQLISGKIYVLDKKTGTLLKTLKIGSEQPITTAGMGTDGTLYFATSDNKIWKIVE